MALTYTSLLNDTYDSYLARYPTGNPIRYHIYQGPYAATRVTTNDFGVSRTFTTEGHSQQESAFIQSVFDRLDSIIEPEFQQVSSSQEADIIVYSSRDSLGEGSQPGWVKAGYFNYSAPRIGRVVWRDFNGKDVFSEAEQQIITHEIGHSLGLDHPDGDGYNPAWTTDSSIMSYYDTGVFPPTWFTPLDIQALQARWGRESSSLPVPTPIDPIGGIATAGNDAGPPDAGINQNLVSALADFNVLDYQMFQDREMTYFIDKKGRAALHKSLLRQGAQTIISKDEAAFARTVFASIDSLTGLSTREVRSPRKADIVLGCLNAKTSYGWYSYFEKNTRYADLAFFDKKGNTLGEREKVDIAEVILYSAGLWDYTDSEYTTFDTVMSNTGVDYYGLTVNDIAALQSIWGSS